MSRSEQRRKAREGGSDMKKFYIVLGAVAVLGVGAVGYSVGSKSLGQAASAPVDVEGLDNTETLVELARGVTKGNPDAPVTIVEFGDYQCPSCGAFAMSIKPQVEQGLVDAGKAKFVFYDFPLVSVHDHAFIAARAARCAGDQDKFWEYQDLLFRSQTTWVNQENPVGTFLDYAASLSMDKNAFESCVKSDRHADVVTANMRLGDQLGVNGTPTILISNGKRTTRLNDYTYQSIEKTIDQLGAAPAPGS